MSHRLCTNLRNCILMWRLFASLPRQVLRSEFRTMIFYYFKHETRCMLPLQLLISSQKVAATFYMSQSLFTNLSESILTWYSFVSLPKKALRLEFLTRIWVGSIMNIGMCYLEHCWFSPQRLQQPFICLRIMCKFEWEHNILMPCSFTSL